MKTTLHILALIFLATSVFATDTLIINYSQQIIDVNGNLDEWDEFESIVFVDTLSNLKTIPELKLEELHPTYFNFSLINKPLSRNKVEVKYFWNKESFNISFKVFDDHLFCENNDYADKPMLHLNDGIELYIDTKAEAGLRMDINDYQFLVDINNNRQVYRGERQLIIVDTLAVPKDFDQNVLFYSAVKKYSDDQKYYVVEISIPFAAIGMNPKSGQVIMIDLCCNDIDYASAGAIVMEFASTNMWSFNWSGFGDFGYPKYWRVAKLVGGPGWFEKITDEYKTNWIYIYLSTLVLAIFVVAFLFIRYKKIKFIPHTTKIDIHKIAIVDKNADKKHESSNKKILSEAAELIAQKKDINLHSDELAKELGISLRSFQRITKEELEITPTTFIHVIKLRLAAQFLSDKKGNVTDAAYEFGFSDPSYFSKMFKKHFGISPIEYSKKNSI